MAAAATSGSVVDLSKLADAKLDRATSAMFFRDDDDDDDGAAGGGGPIPNPNPNPIISSSSRFSWPEAEKTTSKLVSQSALQALCEKFKIPAGYTPTTLDGRWVACRPPPPGSHTVCVYADALEAGMRVPLHRFYVAVLRHYGLAPSQLAPDAWRYLAAFVLLSQDAGVEPTLPVFLFFFSLCTDGDDSVGWYHFRFRSRPGSSRVLFTGKTPRTSPEWKSRFFFLRSLPTWPWPCAVEWGKPSRAVVRMPAVTSEADMAVVKKLQERAGSSGIDVVQFLSRRSLPVAAPPVRFTINPQLKLKKVKVEAAAAAAGPPPQEPTRKRKSFSDAPQTPGWGLVECLAEASEIFAEASVLAKNAMAEHDATKREVAQLKEELSIANAQHRKASTVHAEELKAEHAEHTEQLRKEHAVAVTQLTEQLKKDHSTAVSQLAEQLKEHAVAVTRLKDKHVAAVSQLKNEHTDTVSQLTQQLRKEQAAAVGQLTEQLKNEHSTAILQLTEQLRKEHAVVVTQLTEQLKKEHSIAVSQIKKEHSTAVSQRTEQLRKEHATAVAQLTEQLKMEHDVAVSLLNGKHAATVVRLNQEHAADLARVKDAADMEVLDTKKKFMLLLFPKLDVSLLEQPKLKGDPSAGTCNAQS